MGVQIPTTTDDKQEQAVATDVSKDVQHPQKMSGTTDVEKVKPDETPTGEVIDVDAKKEDDKTENGEQIIEEEEEEEEEEEYNAEEDDEEEEDVDDDDDEEEEDDDENGDTNNLANKMGLTKEVVSQFVSKANLVVRALHDAAKEDEIESIDKILNAEGDNKVEVDATDAFEYTALHHAAENGKLNALKKLISAGAKLELSTRFYSCRPIHYAAFKGHPDIVQELINAGADINAQSEDGRTALFHACLHGNEECVKVLVQAKADASIKDKEEKTPGDVAKSREITDLLEAPAEKKARTE